MFQPLGQAVAVGPAVHAAEGAVGDLGDEGCFFLAVVFLQHDLAVAAVLVLVVNGLAVGVGDGASWLPLV